MYFFADLPQVPRAATWTVPANTLLLRVRGAYVATVANDQRVALKPVRLGRDYGSRVAVLEGVQGDEQLSINLTADLANGTLVTVNRGPGAVSQNIAQRN